VTFAIWSAITSDAVRALPLFGAIAKFTRVARPVAPWVMTTHVASDRRSTHGPPQRSCDRPVFRQKPILSAPRRTAQRRELPANPRPFAVNDDVALPRGRVRLAATCIGLRAP
jgi:hypothetical protein